MRLFEVTRAPYDGAMTVKLAAYLDAVTEKYRHGYLDSDPIGIVHALADPRDVEVGAFLASTLALGRVATIRDKTSDLFARLAHRPAAFLAESPPRRIERVLRGYRHRFFGEEDVFALACAVRRALRSQGSLEACWPCGLPFEEALDGFARRFASAPRAGRRATIPLVAAPSSGSTCKRLVMFLRWMVRGPDGVDFGLWRAPTPAELVIPLDTHLFRLARLLGLTARKTPNWKAAVEVTERLRAIDPDDPVRFDFALARIGIVHGCRARYVASICGACPLLPVCAAARSTLTRR